MTTSNDTPEVEYKQCTKCGETYPLTTKYWPRNKSTKSGFGAYCHECNRRQVRKYKQDNPHKQKEWIENNRERHLKKHREAYYRRTGGKPKSIKQKDGMRYCHLCDTWKPAITKHWHNDSHDPNGLSSLCKDCARKAKREEYYRRTGGNPRPQRRDGDLKQCARCEKWYPATNDFFTAASNRPDGLYNYCRQCTVSYSRNFARAKGVKAKIIVRKNGKKRCSNCHQWFPNTSEYFHKHRNRLDGLSGYCKNCATSIDKVDHGKRKARIRELPNKYTVSDFLIAVDYFHSCCAVCGRQLKDLFGERTAAMDHWIPLASPDCPGTISENIVPLCHGVDGCNTKKKDKDPEVWLIETYGQRKAKQILDRIHTYFEWVKDQTD